MNAPLRSPPADLAMLPNWLVWKLVYIPGKDKPRKVPYYTNDAARNGTQGTDEDRAQLVTFEQATRRVAESGGKYAGVGFAVMPDSGIVALDFDDCVEGGEIAPHVEALCSGTYTELSPSGTGVRAFFKGTLLSHKDIHAERGPFPIEVFGHNGFVTFTGNVTETCALFGWDDSIAPLTPVVLQMYRDRGWDEHEQAGAMSTNPLALLQPTLDITDAQVAEYLQKLNPDMPYDEWVRVGMAVHQQTHGQGFALWHNWSKQGTAYKNEEDCRERWRSFGKYTGGKSVTFAAVVKMSHDAQARAAYAARDEVRARIEACNDEFLLREKLCREIRGDERLDSLAREALAKALRVKFRSLGSDYPVADCRKMVAPAPAERAATGESGKPDWLDGWVWVTELDKFYHCGHGTQITQQSFNNAFNRYMPRADGAAATVLKSAAATAMEDYNVRVVTRAMYLPWANHRVEVDDGTFIHDGLQCVNTFRAASVPQAVSALSPDGCRAVEIVTRHINLICNGRAEVVTYVLSMLAWMVQNPGRKVRHAILIKGIEGDGKSLLGKMMGAVMGQSNVKMISPTVLGTDFSDWAHGACLGVLEEIRLAGHNRHDIYNALKPYITNDNIPIHPKGRAEINVCNTVNYIAFTNHNDALPLSDTDRRWFVVFTPFTNAAQLDQVLAQWGGYDAYFAALHGAIDSVPAELRRWLLDYPISAAFKPDGKAPVTEEKEQMQRASASPEEELVRELLAERRPGMGESILSSTSLLEAAQLADTEVSLQTTTVNRILTRLGWVKLPKRVKWRNRAHRVWINGTVPSCVQDALSATEKVPSCDAPDELVGIGFASKGGEKGSEFEDLF